MTIKSFYVGINQEGIYIQAEYVTEYGFTTTKFFEQGLTEIEAKELLAKLESCKIPTTFNEKTKKLQSLG